MRKFILLMRGDAKLLYRLWESPAFRGFWRFVSKCFNNICRRTLGRIADDEYDATGPTLLEALNDILGAVVGTYDGWSSHVYRGYFAFTSHLLTGDFKMKTVLIDF